MAVMYQANETGNQFRKLFFFIFAHMIEYDRTVASTGYSMNRHRTGQLSPIAIYSCLFVLCLLTSSTVNDKCRRLRKFYFFITCLSKHTHCLRRSSWTAFSCRRVRSNFSVLSFIIKKKWDRRWIGWLLGFGFWPVDPVAHLYMYALCVWHAMNSEVQMKFDSLCFLARGERVFWITFYANHRLIPLYYEIIEDELCIYVLCAGMAPHSN